MSCFSAYYTLFDHLPAGALILSPNRRLARFVVAAYDAWNIQAGRQAWASINAVAWDDWQLALWQQVQANALLPEAAWLVLNSSQTAQLWLDIVLTHTAGYDLLAPEPMAQQAAQAWSYLHDWLLALHQVPAELEETQLWLNWASIYQQTLRDCQWLDPAQLPHLLLELMSAGKLVLPKFVFTLGFDDWTPLQQSVRQTLGQVGVVVEEPEVTLSAQVCTLGVINAAEELLQAAVWAANLLTQEPVEPGVPARIGIVIPDMPARRDEVERVLTRVFEPQYWLLDTPRHGPGFNISVAQPLGQTPLIAAALDVLSLRPGVLDQDVVHRLLMSPFIGCEQELGWRAGVATELAANFPAPGLRQWRQLMDRRIKGTTGTGQDFNQRLVNWFTHWRGQSKSQQSASYWAQAFSHQLELWNWPGERELDSLEYQQLAHWPRLLEQLCSLDWLPKLLTRTEALAALKRLTYTPFAAQTQDSPVQVLGLLEAAGQHFDYLWVLQMEARAWPPAPAPNPLLPNAWQRELAMPRASVDKELLLAQNLTARFAHSAHQVIFSYAQQEGDQPLQPSPLIAVFPPADTALQVTLAQGGEQDYGQLLQAAFRQEDWTDDLGPGLPKGTNQVAGGSQILKDQAACGFRAFAHHRLQARVLPPAKWGVSGLLRGNLLHRALEIIWEVLQTQEQLQAKSDSDLTDLIDQAIEASWQTTDRDSIQTEPLRRIESARMRQILQAWLALDKLRPPFRVLLQESQAQWQLGPLPLRLRYDRVDELPDGRRVVIDYKTSVNTIGAWLGERPDDPQVPLYCLSQPAVVAAAYGQLQLGAVAYVGLQGEAGGLLDLPTPEDYSDADMPADWSALITQWRLVLDSLAEEFAMGRADTNPKYGLKSCLYCDCQPLCRINQRLQNTFEPDDSDIIASDTQSTGVESHNHE